MDSHQLQICTVAEADVNVASAPGYIRAWKLRGYQAALAVPEPSGLCRVALISRVNFRVFKLAEGLATNRCVAGFFEFLCDNEVCQLVIASFYGQSGNAPAAAAQAEDVLAACSHSHLPYIVAGDFNLEPDESILGEARAMGVVRSLDDASCGAPLPATGPGRKRRIDHGLSHWSVAASAILHFDPHFSDHASVCYDIPLDAPPFHVGPRRRPMNHDSTEVIADRFSQVDCAPFREALAQGNVDNAWCILSDWAEDCLTMNDTEAQARSCIWKPQKLIRPARNCIQGSAAVRALAKLQRQLAVWTETSDQHVLTKIFRSLPRVRALVPDLPWVQEDHLSVLSDFVSVELRRHQAQEAAAVKAQWKQLLRDDTNRQRTFVKARADAQLEFEKQHVGNTAAKCAGPIHPSVMVRQQAQAWTRKWQVKPSVHHHAIDQVLAKVPAVRSTRLDLQFNAESLRSIAASIADKAPGPDSWQAGSLYKMPLAWWAMAAELWSHVWSNADVPTAWKYAKVTLIRKKGGPTTRPITLTQIMWRIGAKFVARALRQWAPEWASESDHGGLPGRSFSDVLFQVQAALNRGMHTAALMDVAGYFDAMNAEMLTRVFTHLGAPVQLAPLLESFYSGAFRYFCFEGSFDPEYHVVHSGIAQGCPLSPIAAAALSHCWSEYIKSSCNNICVQIFMDDRTLMLEPSGSCQDLERAISASANFDAAFSLSLSSDKCFIASSRPSVQTAQLADRWGFSECSRLELLGVCFDFEGQGTIPKFSLRKAVLRLRLLRWTQASTRSRINLVRALIMPCLAWASGFAQPSRADLEAVRAEVRFLFSGGYGGDTATVAFFELLGWGLEPNFALDLGLCRLAWRWIARPPVWQELLPITSNPHRWLACLPQLQELLARTGWWLSDRADAFYRRDAQGGLRKVCIGYESFAVLRVWLEDFYRDQFLRRCKRVAHSLHRPPEPDLAQGLDLPAPPQPFRVQFQGHKAVLADQSSMFHRRAAFLSGGTTWFFNKAATATALHNRTRCLCGSSRPSRAHLLWVCPRTEDIRKDLEPPKHRGEERLLSKHLREQPLPPPAVDAAGLVEEIADTIRNELVMSKAIVIAAKDGIAAHSVVVNKCDQAFSGGNDSEDQSPFRAEMCALKLALEALSAAVQHGARGSVIIAVDCEAALKARFNCPSMPLFGVRLRLLASSIRSSGVELSFVWVPAHNRHSGWRSPHPDFSAAQLRSLNDAADCAAKACVTRRLQGSLRESWAAEARRVKAWESAAVRASARAAQRLSDHLEARTASRSASTEGSSCHSNLPPGVGV